MNSAANDISPAVARGGCAVDLISPQQLDQAFRRRPIGSHRSVLGKSVKARSVGEEDRHQYTKRSATESPFYEALKNVMRYCCSPCITNRRSASQRLCILADHHYSGSSTNDIIVSIKHRRRLQPLSSQRCYVEHPSSAPNQRLLDDAVDIAVEKAPIRELPCLILQLLAQKKGARPFLGDKSGNHKQPIASSGASRDARVTCIIITRGIL